MPGRVLVIDDERGMRVTLQEFLAEEGHDVHVAETPEQALEIASTIPLDVVLCDIVLPGRMSGVDLLRLLRESQPHLEVILMTGDPALETAVSAMRLRAVDYLSKPVDPSMLQQTVARAVKSKQLGDENRRLDAENREVRKKLETLVHEQSKQLEENQANYQNLVETAIDGICILENGLIRFVNQRLQRMLSPSGKDLLGRSIREFIVPEDMERTVSLYQEFHDGSRELGIVPSRIQSDEGRRYYIELNGSQIIHHGCPCELVLVRDVTEQQEAQKHERQYIQKLELLARISVGLVDLPLDDSLYDYAAQAISQLAQGSVVVVSSFSLESTHSRVEAISGLGEYEETLTSFVGGSLVGMNFPLDPRGFLESSALERDTKSLYEIAEGSIPKELCEQMEELFQLDSIYVAGFSWRDEVYGSVIIIHSGHSEPLFPSIIETFCNQVAIALQREQARKALGESEERFRILSEQAMLGLAMFQQERIIYLNQALAHIFGYDEEEIRHWTTQDFLERVQNEDRESLELLLHPAERLKPEHSSLHSFRFTNRFNEKIWVDAYARIIKHQGQRTCIMAFVDTTKRRRTEESLRRSEQRYRTLVENAPLGIISADAQGTILEVNLPLLEILGSTSMEQTRSINLLTNPHLLEAGIADDCRQCLETGEAVFAERMYLSKWERSVYLRYHVQPSKNERGQIVGLQAIVEDISKQKREEQERRKLENQLFQSQKMDSIGKLAGGIAHDFNNLLTGISGHVELARLDIKSSDPLVDTLNEIHRASQRAKKLTQQLLAFSRKQILEPEVVDPNHLIRNLQGLLVRLIGEHIEFRTILPKNKGAIKVDPAQIEQVVVNLALNARDAMPEGGRLTLSTSQAVLDETFCQDHENLVPGEYLRLSVEDTGCGMTPDVLARVFEPFFSTKPRDKASGLGLAMVYGIVRQHDGALEVYSHPGAGSTFNIYLPLIHEQVNPIQTPDLTRSLPRGTEGILLVEDDRLVREMTAKVLARLGYQVLQARNGGEALLLFQKYSKGITLLLTDVIMPGMSGRTLADRIEQQNPEIRVLYISGHTEHEIVTRQVLNEGLHFLEKPFTPSDLAKKLRQVLVS